MDNENGPQRHCRQPSPTLNLAVMTAEPAPIALAARTHCVALTPRVGAKALGGPEPRLALAVPEMCSQPVNVLNGDLRLKVTASGGVAKLEPGDSLQSLVARADGALYKAKESGRNCLLIACGSDVVPLAV